jgi:NADH-quinone oxidoreductase subunit C
MADEARSKGAAWVLENHGDAVVETGEFHGQDWVTVEAAAVHEVVKGLAAEAGFDMVEDLTAVDYLDRPDVEGRFRVVYHLLSLERHEIFRLKAFVPDDDTEVPTVSDLFPGANWLEREVYDMFGIRFAGHPNLKRILMDEDWDGFPCRRDYPCEGHIPIEDPMREKDYERGVAGEFKY